MSKEIKTNKITGEVVIKDGNYSFKQFGIYPDIIQLIEELQQENKQLKDNWNKLKEFINLGYYDSYMYSSTIINKMKELEKSDYND